VILEREKKNTALIFFVSFLYQDKKRKKRENFSKTQFYFFANEHKVFDLATKAVNNSATKSNLRANRLKNDVFLGVKDVQTRLKCV